MQDEKVFSLEEANNLLPILRYLIAKVVQSANELAFMRKDIKKAVAKASDNGGSKLGMHYLKSLTTLTSTVTEIKKLGVLVKDYQLGLCDFPHIKEGRIVYLCWKLGEDKVEWWHEIESGFSGRQEL